MASTHFLSSEATKALAIGYPQALYLALCFLRTWTNLPPQGGTSSAVPGFNI
jgi:hypothetical protein